MTLQILVTRYIANEINQQYFLYLNHIGYSTILDTIEHERASWLTIYIPSNLSVQDSLTTFLGSVSFLGSLLPM